MAEMLVKSESLTSIADKIRVLSGTTEPMGLDAMENHVGEANTDVATEADLIAQIAGALEGKAAGGGSCSNISAEWQDVSTLPRTYVTTTIPVSFYIEIPTNFKMIAVRCLIFGVYYSANAVVMNDGSIVIQSSRPAYCDVSVLNDENVICISIGEGFTTAEYLIV